MRLLVFVLLLLCYDSYSFAGTKAEIPKIWNVNRANEYFTGREALLESLHGSFTKQSNFVAIVGSSGIGKTQLAKKYVSSYRKYYDIVWWFDGDQNISEQFMNLGKEWNRVNEPSLQVNLYVKQNELIQQIKNRLRATNLRWLLIFDNVEEGRQIEEYIPELHNSSGSGDILVTSKNPLAWKNILNLDKFTRDESVELIVSITGENKKENANALAELLKDYPLAIAQAALYIKHHPSSSIEEYRNLFLTKRQELWKDDQEHKTILTILSLSINNLKQESPHAYELLVLSSFLNHKNIPCSLLRKYSIQHLKLNEAEQENVITSLLKYSLLLKNKIDPENNKSSKVNTSLDVLNKTFTIHEIIQLVVQDSLSSEEKLTYLNKAVATMDSFLVSNPSLLILTKIKNDYIWPHVKKFIALSIAEEAYSNHLLAIMIKEVEHYIFDLRDLKTASMSIEEAKKIIAQIKALDITLVRFYLINSFFYAWHDVDYKKAIQEVHKAYNLLKQMNGYQVELFMVYSRFVHFYNHFGQNKEAIKYEPLGEELIVQFPDSINNKSTFYRGLAEVYFDEGQLDRALDYANKAIVASSKNIKNIIPTDFPLYFQEIEILLRMQGYNKAYARANQLYDLATYFFNNYDNELMAYAMILHAYASHKKDKKDEKVNLISGQNMLVKLLGNNANMRKMYAKSHVFLGEMYESEAKYLEAMTEYSIAEKLYDGIYYHAMEVATDDLSEVYTKLACIYVKLGDNKIAQYYLDLHRNLFGYSHRRSNEITYYMVKYAMLVSF